MNSMNLSYIVEELLSGKTIYRPPVPESSALLMPYFVHFLWFVIEYIYF